MFCFEQALPYFYNGGQVTASATGTSVTITWNEWKQTTDYGTGPVNYYKVYYWNVDSTISESKKVSGSSIDFKNLSADTMYNFSVVAVKNHELLEGPFSMNVTAITGCDGRSVTKIVLKQLI